MRSPVGAVRREQGQATVELALCLPVLVLVVAALVELGLLAGDRARLWHAAREAARVGAVDPSVQSMTEAAERAGLRPIEVTVAPEASGRRAGEPLTVTVVYSPPGRVPLLGSVLAATELEARAAMRIEQP